MSRRKYDHDKIVMMRKEGMGYKEIAKVLQTKHTIIAGICKKYGLCGRLSTFTRDVSIGTTAEIVRRKGFEYVSGYVNTHSKITVRCPECGGAFDVMYHNIRDTQPLCKVCVSIATAQRRDAKQAEERAESAAREEERARRKAKRDEVKAAAEAQKLNAVHVCVNCGSEYTIAFTGYNSTKYCSIACSKRYINRHSIDKRWKKIKSRPHDNDITLERVFAINNGICYLCGRKCSWEDKVTYADGTIVAGGKYPSIEHIIPISRGGCHEWTNVALACRDCNSKKRDSVITAYDCGRVEQIAMAF